MDAAVAKVERLRTARLGSLILLLQAIGELLCPSVRGKHWLNRLVRALLPN
jgi:hypothetical protein